MRSPPARRSIAGGLAFGLVALLLFSLLSTSSVAGSPAAPASTGNGVLAATIDFNGVDVSTHSTVGSAIPTSFSGRFTTIFDWSSVGPRAFVTQGSIQIRFFGATIATSAEEVGEGGNGTITLVSDLTQNQYLYEGVYQVAATLSDNGTTLLSENFFVWVQAAYHLTVVNIVLVIVVILEIYQIAALARVPKSASAGRPPSKEPPAPVTSGSEPPRGGS